MNILQKLSGVLKAWSCVLVERKTMVYKKKQKNMWRESFVVFKDSTVWMKKQRSFCLKTCNTIKEDELWGVKLSITKFKTVWLLNIIKNPKQMLMYCVNIRFWGHSGSLVVVILNSEFNGNSRFLPAHWDTNIGF